MSDAFDEEELPFPLIAPTIREKWYLIPAHQFEMVKSLRFRYLSCKKAIRPDGSRGVFTRYYTAYNVDLLKKAIRHLHADEEAAKLYYDLATWKYGQFPMFSWQPDKRREQRLKWDKDSLKAFESLEFAIDLDAPDTEHWQLAHKDALKLYSFFTDSGKVKLGKTHPFVKKYGTLPPFRISFSGKKGFHFCIPASYFVALKGKAASKWVEHHLELAHKIEDWCKTKRIDYSIYDFDRVLALPYSLSDAGMVVLPLTKEQLLGFNLEMVDPEYVIKNINIRGRGLLYHNNGEEE